MTEPTVGAWVCASGSHVWNGNIGTLMAKPRNIPPKISNAVVRVMLSLLAIRYSMEKLPSGADAAPLLKNSAMKDSSMNAEPNSVKRKNLSDAYRRCSPPHTPIMKYIGSRTISKKTKNRMRSCATNVPAIPTWRSRISMRKALAFPGSGMWFQL